MALQHSDSSGVLCALVVSIFLFAPAGASAFVCGGQGAHVLVAYDTKYNSTADIAALIGLVLCARGFDVSVFRADNEDLEDISSYDVVIVGSPIYYGVWLPAAQAFLKKHEQTLAGKTVAYFIASNLLREGYASPEKEQIALQYYVQPVLDAYPDIKPLEPIGNFGGKVDFSDFTLFERIIMKAFGYYDNDSRDWQKIAQWADQIAALVSVPPLQSQGTQ
ncbi:MAG: hypothetical protein N3B18_13565 [Desulfobacterota bacterium]|nr:hypothetical protein [Thermodesulfobacteriota bacterium]